jgi:glycosyltransferase involved in cell wall biosynthesis
MKKVSIILPVYNVAPYLDDAFQSLINQTLEEIEIIVVNDGSTDNSQDIIDKYAALDSRIKCYYQDNQGLSGARNTGMKYCQSEYIYFMDSDDVLELYALEKCYNYANHNQADVCFFDAYTFKETDLTALSRKYDRSSILQENKQYKGEYLFDFLMNKRQHKAVVWLHFIKHSYLKSIQLKFYSGIIHEDELFTPQLLIQTDRILYLNESLVKHRVRKSSIIGRGYSKRNLDCYLTVIDELFKFQKSPIIKRFAKYTLSRVFYTGHVIPFKDKLSVFWRATTSGYLKYIGLKSSLVFWLK